MMDADTQMTRREYCRAGLRLAALAGLLAAGVSLVQGRGATTTATAPCGNAADCPRCPLRRACPATRPGSAPAEASR